MTFYILQLRNQCPDVAIHFFFGSGNKFNRVCGDNLTELCHLELILSRRPNFGMYLGKILGFYNFIKI